MDELQKLQQQQQALQAAHDDLLNHQPTDMVAATQIANRILALNRRMLALLGGGEIPQISPAQVQALQAAVNALQAAIAQSAGVTQIVAAATALASL